ncbi:6164_t:CDS:1, partial [Acaulospora colombiana]
MATTSNLSFDRYIARSQSRSRSSSANSSTLSQSLPPPPRVKKPSSPDPLAPSSTFQASRNLKSSSPARQPNISMASTVSPPPDRDQPRRPNPFADFGS